MDEVKENKNVLDEYLDAGGDPDLIILSKKHFKNQIEDAWNEGYQMALAEAKQNLSEVDNE